MTTVTLEKNYKKLENRLENLEKLIKVIIENELVQKELSKLGKISHKLDEGTGKRFYSRQEFLRYLKSL